MDAKTLYREGITAVRENNLKRGRDLLMQALKIEPNNEVAWLWLSRTVDDPERKIQCLERALQVNPDNVQTKTLIEKIKNPSADPRISTSEIVAAQANSAAEPPVPEPKPPVTTPAPSSVHFMADESRAIARPVIKNKPTPSPFTLPVEDVEPVGETITQIESVDNSWLDEQVGGLTPMVPMAPKPATTTQTTPTFTASDEAAEVRVPEPASETTDNSWLDEQVGGLTPMVSVDPTPKATAVRTPPPFTLADDEADDNWLNQPAKSSRPRSTPRREKPRTPAHQELAIQALMKKAQVALEKEQIDEAIEQWVQVLDIEVDHIQALGNAVRHLSRLKYLNDARELTWNAINAGTTHPSVYMTAIGIAERQGNPGEADDLRLKLVQLPEANEQMVVKTVEHFIGQGLATQAIQALDYALPLHPKSQKLLVQRAQLAQDMSLSEEALHFYERTAQLGTRTPEGKLADEQLLKFTPRLSDKERGSIWIAVREAFGFGFVYLLLGWQDAGLNLSQLGTGRLLGVILSVIGGYFVISATSSPQQRPLAKWLGGKVPEPANKEAVKTAYEQSMVEPEAHTELPILPVVVRIIFGLIGAAILIGAFALVFSTALNLLINPNPTPFHIPTLQELLEEAERAVR